MKLIKLLGIMLFLPLIVPLQALGLLVKGK